jgi:hypothetical protein
MFRVDEDDLNYSALEATSLCGRLCSCTPSLSVPVSPFALCTSVSPLYSVVIHVCDRISIYNVLQTYMTV